MTESTTELAKKEFNVIRDVLLVPLKQDLQNEELPKHRKWKGGCIPIGLPDLVPVNPEGVERFCKQIDNPIDNKKYLVVIVKNKGNVTAPPSTTSVTFVDIKNFNVEPFDQFTKEIPAGESTELEFKIPDICFGSDCLFIITVNAKFEIDESDLTNNVAVGLCRSGPL